MERLHPRGKSEASQTQGLVGEVVHLILSPEVRPLRLEGLDRWWPSSYRAERDSWRVLSLLIPPPAPGLLDLCVPT